MQASCTSRLLAPELLLGTRGLRGGGTGGGVGVDEDLDMLLPRRSSVSSLSRSDLSDVLRCLSAFELEGASTEFDGDDFRPKVRR